MFLAPNLVLPFFSDIIPFYILFSMIYAGAIRSSTLKKYLFDWW